MTTALITALRSFVPITRSSVLTPTGTLVNQLRYDPKRVTPRSRSYVTDCSRCFVDFKQRHNAVLNLKHQFEAYEGYSGKRTPGQHCCGIRSSVRRQTTMATAGDTHSNESRERLKTKKELLQLALMIPLALGSFSMAVYNGYVYFCVTPEPIDFVWNPLKNDPWLEEQLGAPLRISGSWSGYVHDEEAKFSLPVAGSKKGRSGTLLADVIRDPNTSHWDVVSVRFARTDAEAAQLGFKAGTDQLMFTSNQGPGTKTTTVPLETMPALPTDDVLASQAGYSVTAETRCPYHHEKTTNC